MHPSLYLEAYQQQVSERLAEARRQRLVTQVLRSRIRSQRLEDYLSQFLSQLVHRMGFWLRLRLKQLELHLS